MEFKLEKKELERLRKWQRKIEKKYGNQISYSYVFSPIGLGSLVSAIAHIEKSNKQNITEIKINLTDYDSW